MSRLEKSLDDRSEGARELHCSRRFATQRALPVYFIHRFGVMTAVPWERECGAVTVLLAEWGCRYDA